MFLKYGIVVEPRFLSNLMLAMSKPFNLSQKLQALSFYIFDSSRLVEIFLNEQRIVG